MYCQLLFVLWLTNNELFPIFAVVNVEWSIIVCLPPVQVFL